MSSVETSDVPCFCKTPAKTYSNKKGNTMVRCGVELDYKKIVKKLQKLTSQKEKRSALKKMALGCNMNLKLSDAEQLQSIGNWCFKTFPKCQHDLHAKLGISHSKNNDGKAFWTCPVQYPDIGCEFFQWAVNQVESETSNSEDEATTSKSKRKSKKKDKGKRKCESTDEETSSSESEDESPRLKRKSTKKFKKL